MKIKQSNSAHASRELTPLAIILGSIISIVFGAANAYLGLRVGLTVSASIPAAVVSMGVLRLILHRNSILENNMVQTIGSAGESLAAGAVFTLPAIYLWAQAGICEMPRMWSITTIALAGGVLGVLFMIPLRKSTIEDDDQQLAFPEGRACAEVLKAGEGNSGGAALVFGGLGAAAIVKMITDLVKFIPPSISWPIRRIRGEIGVDISTALLGVGYVLGLKVATLIFSGSFLGWMVLIPTLCAFSPSAAAAYADGGASAVWSQHLRFIGAGAIAVGGFFSLAKTFPQLTHAFRGLRHQSGDGRDLPIGRAILGIALVIIILAFAPNVPLGIFGAILVALFGLFFAAVSSRMVGLVGSSSNPASGMAIATLVIASLVLKACGCAGAAGMLTSMTIGSLVCIIAVIAGDTSQDLKTGFLVGGTPWKQQIGELIGVAASGLAIAGTMWLLNRAWGFGGETIPAPQAMLMKSVVEGIMGGSLPWELLGIGAGIAAVIEILRIPVMPFAIGLYLPIHLNTTIFIGGILRTLANRLAPTKANHGVLISAGLIAGEGIAGILLALLTVVSG